MSGGKGFCLLLVTLLLSFPSYMYLGSGFFCCPASPSQSLSFGLSELPLKPSVGMLEEIWLAVLPWASISPL